MYMYMYMYMYLSLYISLSLYIYIYIYVHAAGIERWSGLCGASTRCSVSCLATGGMFM